MATCKECLHFEVCDICTMTLGNASRTHLMPCDDCPCFKDRTRFIELPCKELCEKQGDDIYVIDDGEVVAALLYVVGFDQTMTDVIESASDVGDGELKYHKHRFADVGKTVFLTREEAEKVLAEMEAES